MGDTPGFRGSRSIFFMLARRAKRQKPRAACCFQNARRGSVEKVNDLGLAFKKWAWQLVRRLVPLRRPWVLRDSRSPGSYPQ